ncbi:MAG: ribosomal protein S18 acetylase RimI-like enzyme [Saprospiraceae bacterium]|jgi:ribosomal protein S18 acetylase RimI-like enzyme
MNIHHGTIKEVVELSDLIPEFNKPHRAAEYEKRLSDVPHLILIAKINEKSAGFKVGYERNGYFYSWMGGVLPDFREKGVAKALLVEMENWARARNYPHLTFKTSNKMRTMLLFGLRCGFDIIDFEKREPDSESRIILRKKLLL